ncbi:Ribonuclease H domain [Sesbania bispinosa]|nr:Ribonuclease H domain [Sesbania bispinosa]
MTIPLQEINALDGWCWKLAPDGCYSSRMGYVWLQNQNMQSMSVGAWRWVWHLATPEKVRFTIWLGLHNSLPTKEVLHYQNIVDSATCPRCMNHSESIIHCLRDYTKAKVVWDRLGFSTKPSFFNHNLFSCLRKFARGKSEILFLATIWWIWRWRNKEVFDADVWDIEFLIKQILLMQTDVQNSLNSDAQLFGSNWWWAPRPPTYLKLNIDGSFRYSDHVMGVGGVLRDVAGNWCWGFAGNAGCGDVIQAELLALREGLSYVWTEGNRCIMCETDSLEVINLLSKDIVTHRSQINEILRDINALRNRHWELQVKHVVREANMLANALAKEGAAQKLILASLECPSFPFNSSFSR